MHETAEAERTALPKLGVEDGEAGSDGPDVAALRAVAHVRMERGTMTEREWVSSDTPAAQAHAEMEQPAPSPGARPLAIAGLWLGLGLGGFFDGIVFHQILQWHHMLTSAGYPPTSVANLDVNTLADGLFHAATYLCTVLGLVVLWRASRRADVCWSSMLLIGAILAGWGVFNLVEGIVDHQVLGIHHVRDDLPPGVVKATWDIGFLIWGAVMLGGGWLMIRRGRLAASARGAQQ